MKPSLFVLSSVALLTLLATGVVRGQQPGPGAVAPHPAPPPAPTQPLPFSHRTHAGVGVQCQTCHTGPGAGREMTFPATATCMTCHRSIAVSRPSIQTLAEHARTDQVIPWVRVYRVLPGVTWAHRPHLQAGVQCQTCHGPVGELEAMTVATSVTGMASCINCHQARQASTACSTCHAWPDGR